MAKRDLTTIPGIINDFTDKSTKHYSSHAYAAGYLTSLLGRILQDLPAQKRELVLKELESWKP